MARKPPNNFQRWATDHPFQWGATVSGVVLVAGFGGLTTGDGLVIAITLAFVLLAGFAACVGAFAARRMVRNYDEAKLSHRDGDSN
jgi:hypothetical protein